MFGRSRGDFSIKAHPKTDFDGQPLAFHLSGGEASDSPVLPLLLDLGPDLPRAALTDKGYDAGANCTAARAGGICLVIPTKSNAKNRPDFFSKAMHEGQARIEQAIGRLKRFKRVALQEESQELLPHHLLATQLYVSQIHPHSLILTSTKLAADH